MSKQYFPKSPHTSCTKNCKCKNLNKYCCTNINKGDYCNKSNIKYRLGLLGN
jgi:hypothetical protein